MIKNFFVTQEGGLFSCTAYLVGSEGSGKTVELTTPTERQIYTDIETVLGLSSVSTQFFFNGAQCEWAVFAGESGGTVQDAALAPALDKILELQTLIESKL